MSWRISRFNPSQILSGWLDEKENFFLLLQCFYICSAGGYYDGSYSNVIDPSGTWGPHPPNSHLVITSCRSFVHQHYQDSISGVEVVESGDIAPDWKAQRLDCSNYDHNFSLQHLSPKKWNLWNLLSHPSSHCRKLKELKLELLIAQIVPMFAS